MPALVAASTSFLSHKTKDMVAGASPSMTRNFADGESASAVSNVRHHVVSNLISNDRLQSAFYDAGKPHSTHSKEPR
jgi:hypothetical protein